MSLFSGNSGNTSGTGPVSPMETSVVIDKMPEFPGGKKAMDKFISDNIRYPEEAKNANVQGTIYITFVISKEGKVKDPVVERSTGNSSMEKEAQRIVLIMPDWTPAKQKGKAVPVYYSLPVDFKLQ
jgi:protein TonB